MRGHGDTRTHSHTKPTLHPLPEGWTLSPQLPALIAAASLQAFCGSAGASVLAKRPPGSECRPGPSLGAAEPERAARQPGGVAETGPQQQRCGALPENQPGRSRQSSRSGRAVAGAARSQHQPAPKKRSSRLLKGDSTGAFHERLYRSLPARRQPGPGSVPLPPPAGAPRGRPSPGPEAAPGAAQPRALRLGSGHTLRAAQTESCRAPSAAAPRRP